MNAMNLTEAYNWMAQPGIKAMMPSDPYSQEAFKIIMENTRIDILNKKAKKQLDEAELLERIGA